MVSVDFFIDIILPVALWPWGWPVVMMVKGSSSFTLITTGRIETYQIATCSIRTLLKMDYWSPKRVELVNVTNKINHQILCILLDYRYIAKWYTVHTTSNYEVYLSCINTWWTNYALSQGCVTGKATRLRPCVVRGLAVIHRQGPTIYSSCPQHPHRLWGPPCFLVYHYKAIFPRQ